MRGKGEGAVRFGYPRSVQAHIDHPAVEAMKAASGQSSSLGLSRAVRGLGLLAFSFRLLWDVEGHTLCG
ncbi:MAG: hypothetical protein WDW38_004785 [Sanguina aurantia]